MRIAIWPGTTQPWSDVLQVARHAADTGWDTVYLADHFMPNTDDPAVIREPMLEAGTATAALGALVPRVRVGQLVYGMTYRHPAVLANMAATADHLSGGRTVLGLGAGWQVNEHEQYGIALPGVRARLDRFVEGLRIIRGLLRDERTTVHGEHYRVTDAVCEPKPVQQRLPLLIGGSGEKRMLGIVAEYADIWNAWGGPELIAHKSAVLDRFCAEQGRDPREIERTAQAPTVVHGPLPEGMKHTPIGGTPERLKDTIEQYRAVGLAEWIVPDFWLGDGAERLKNMDTILELARA